MSGWTHAMCVPCWNERNQTRPAHSTGQGNEETCCWCGGATDDGIYMRADPTSVQHCDHQDDEQ